MATITTRIDTSTNKDLLKTGTLREIFDNTLKEVPQYYKQMVNDLSTDQIETKDQRLAGFLNASEHVEGQNIEIQSPQVGGQKTYTLRYFGTGFRITRQMNTYNKYALYQRWAKGIAKAQKDAKDVEVHVMFNSPTSASLTCGTGFDGKAIGHVTHTGLRPNSTADNYSNYPNSSLSQAAIETARYYFVTLLNDMGLLMGARPDTLIFEPTLYPLAVELTASPYKAHMAGQTTNVIGDMGLSLFENPRLTSTTAWFMAAAKDGDYDFNCFTGMEPNFIEKDAPDRTQDRMVLTDQDFTYGYGDQRLLYVGKA